MVLSTLCSSFASAFSLVGAVTSAACMLKNGVHSDVVELERVYSMLAEKENGAQYVMELRKIHYEQQLESIRFKEENRIYEEKGKILGLIPYSYRDESEFISATPRIKEKISQIDRKKPEDRISLARRYHAGEIMFLDAIRNVVATDDDPNQYAREDDRAFANSVYKFIDPRFGKVYQNDECGNLEDYDITLFPNVRSIDDWKKSTIADKIAFGNMLIRIKEKAKFNTFIDNKLKAMGLLNGNIAKVSEQEIKEVFEIIDEEKKQLREPFKVVDQMQLMKYNFLSDARNGNSKIKNAFKEIEKPVVTNKEPEGSIDQKEEFDWKNAILPEKIKKEAQKYRIPFNDAKMIWCTLDHYFGQDFNFMPKKDPFGILLVNVSSKINPAINNDYLIDTGSIIGGRRLGIKIRCNNSFTDFVWIPVEDNLDIVFKLFVDVSYSLTADEFKEVSNSSVFEGIARYIDFSGDKDGRLNNLSDADFHQFILNCGSGFDLIGRKYSQDVRFRIDWETFSDISNFTLVSDKFIKPYYFVHPTTGQSMTFNPVDGRRVEIRDGVATDKSSIQNSDGSIVQTLGQTFNSINNGALAMNSFFNNGFNGSGPFFTTEFMPANQ